MIEGQGKFRVTLILAALLAGLATAWFILDRPQAEPKVEEKIFAWRQEPDTVRSVEIELPATGQRQKWVLDPGGEWRFDPASAGVLDENRWAGIPLLVSALRAERVASDKADKDALATFGLLAPRLILRVGTEDGKTLEADVGAKSPDGSGDYVWLVGSPTIHLVSAEWSDVLEGLLLRPPVAAKTP